MAEIELPVFPPPDKLKSRGGRDLKLGNPKAIIAEFNREALALPIDKEHSIYLANQALASKDYSGVEKLNKGSCGWIKSLKQKDDGSIWASVELTATAKQEIANKDYIYTSPHFQASSKTGEITKLLSLSFVKQPDFNMPAINTNTADGKAELTQHVAFYQPIPEQQTQQNNNKDNNDMTNNNQELAAKNNELEALKEGMKKLEFETKLASSGLPSGVTEQIACLAGKVNFEEGAGLVGILQKNTSPLTQELTVGMQAVPATTQSDNVEKYIKLATGE